MSDRLEELRRQRALVAEQLAWLDREIASASGQTAPPAPPLPPTPPPPPAPAAQPPAYTLRQSAAAILSRPPEVAAAPEPAAFAEADKLLDEYRVPEADMKSDLWKGCLLYFFGALAVVVLVVVALYFFFQRGK